jgi:type IV secretion system protein VirB11
MSLDEIRSHIYIQLGSVRDLLAQPGVFEVCVNKPGEAWVETAEGWLQYAVPEMTFDRLYALGTALATLNSDTVSFERPILSAVAPDGERVQMVFPPVVESNVISMTIRKPSGVKFSLAQLNDKALFSAVGRSVKRTGSDGELLSLFEVGETARFLALAVKARKNILISGATGSGKTTLSKALIGEIPLDERLISIEDTPEFFLTHPNCVSLKYSKDAGGKKVGPQQLLESTLRMRPDRILLQELRDGTAFFYVRNVNSGHPGSITTVHADTCDLAFEQMTLLVKQSEAGSDLDREDIRSMLEVAIDVVIQCERIGGAFKVSEMWFGALERGKRRGASKVKRLA